MPTAQKRNPNQTKETTQKRHATRSVRQGPVELTEQFDPAVLQRAMAAPRLLRPADAQALQRTVGNRAVTRLLTGSSPQLGNVRPSPPPVLQAKLMVGPVGDQYEQEANRVAQQVMSMPAPAGQQPAQRREEEELQMKPLAASITPLVQRQEEGEELAQKKPVEALQLQGEGKEELAQMQAQPTLEGGEIASDLESAIQSARGGGQPLPDTVRGPMEQALGADFSGVKVHTNAQSDILNRSLSSRAFTMGQDLFFKRGEYNPRNRGGQELIAHELTHVLQQSPTSKIIQRRIGFEVETGIPITKRTKKKNKPSVYNNLYVSDVGDDLKILKGKLSVDHIPGKPEHKATAKENFKDWPIIELVTDPIDDSLKLSEFEPIARQWIDTLKAIKTKAQGSPPAKKYKGKYYIGLPTAQGYGDWDRIAPQVTAGVPLDQVGKVLSSFELSGRTSQFKATQYGMEAPSKAASIMQDLFEKYPPYGDGAGVLALKGLLMMMINHLLVGGDPTIAQVIYMKNRAANIMYKTKLSTVRQNIIKMPFPSRVLGTKEGRKHVRRLLLAITSRDPSDHLYMEGDKKGGAASDVGVQKWIDEVLAGTDDQLFDEIKNEWSKEIKPDAENEVIIELRRIGAFVKHDNYSLEDDKGLLAFLKKVYGANSLIKSRQL